MKTATLSQCEPGIFCCNRCDLKVPTADLPLLIKCQKCECSPCWIKSPDETLTRPFKKAKRQTRGLPGTKRRFAFAVLRHALNLFRRRTPWEIHELHAICQTCPFYAPAKAKTKAPRGWWQRLLKRLGFGPADGSCKKCGCRLSRDATWMNKLLWRSEKCPEGKWHATTFWGSLVRHIKLWIVSHLRKESHED